jgi:hypothetical protein
MCRKERTTKDVQKARLRLNRTVGTNAKCQTLFFRFGIPAIFPSHGRDKRQTPNTEYTIINAVNKILIVLGQICVPSDVGHRSLTHKH